MKGNVNTPYAGKIRVKIIRANGDIEDYGVVAGMYRNPIKNALFQAYMVLKRLYRRWHTF